MSEAAPNPGTPAPNPGAENQPAPFATPWSAAQGVYMIGEGEAAKPWWEGIQEEPVREYMKSKNYANPYEASIAAFNANKMNKLTPDIEAFVAGKATPEQEGTIFKLMGRPENADAYELKVGEGETADPELMKFGKDLFFDLGLSPARAEKAFSKWQEFATKHNAAINEQVRAQNETELTDLGKRWGTDLEANKVAGNKAVAALGLSNDLVKKVEDNIGSAAIVELLATIGKKLGEGKMIAGNNQSDPNDPATMTPEAAKSRIAALQADGEFQKKYTDASHPEHAYALRVMEGLFAKAG